MNQPWNTHLQIPDKLKKQCEKIKPVDIMVGVLCKDVETTVLNVLNVINEGLYRYFPDYRKAIVISEGNSTDKTKEVIDLFQPYNSVVKIITTDISAGGKGESLFAGGKGVFSNPPIPGAILGPSFLGATSQTFVTSDLQFGQIDSPNPILYPQLGQ